MIQNIAKGVAKSVILSQEYKCAASVTASRSYCHLGSEVRRHGGSGIERHFLQRILAVTLPLRKSVINCFEAAAEHAHTARQPRDRDAGDSTAAAKAQRSNWSGKRQLARAGRTMMKKVHHMSKSDY